MPFTFAGWKQDETRKRRKSARTCDACGPRTRPSVAVAVAVAGSPGDASATRRQRPVVRDSPPSSLDRDRGIRGRTAHTQGETAGDARAGRRTNDVCRAARAIVVVTQYRCAVSRYLRRPTSVEPTKIPCCSPGKKKHKRYLCACARGASSVCARIRNEFGVLNLCVRGRPDFSRYLFEI